MHELKKGLGEGGDLVLILACTKCPAQFELNNQSVALAIGMEVSFIEYVRSIQSISRCSVCNGTGGSNDN